MRFALLLLAVSSKVVILVKEAVDKSVIDQILNTMLGEGNLHLRHLKRHFVSFGWIDHTFIPLLSSLPRTYLSHLVRDVAANAHVTLSEEEIEDFKKAIAMFLDEYEKE